MRHRNWMPYIKGSIFIIVFVVLFATYSKVMVPKFYSDNDWPTTSTYLEFYQMKENTVDVLVFGSSRAVSSFSPQVLYDEYGIRSYNLACEEQNLLISYYWLREALRFQKPKAVILEPHMLFECIAEEPLNTSERCTRKAMDYMKWSKLKFAAVRDICEHDSGQTMSSYLLPALRFHERWKDLQKQDFVDNDSLRISGLKGFTPLSERNADTYGCIDTELEGGAQEQTVPVMREYLDKIALLCKQEGISLLLYMAPSRDDTQEKYAAIAAYAQEKDIPFIDLNGKNNYEAMNYDYSHDNLIYNHVNIWGAQKVTDYLGKIISEQCNLTAVVDEQWENTQNRYDLCRQECDLRYEDDFKSYLFRINQLVQSGDYSIFAAVRGDGGKYIDEQTQDMLSILGAKTDLRANEGNGYCLFLTKGFLEEAFGEGEQCLSGELEPEKIFYEVKSQGYAGGNSCSILIAGSEYALNAEGINWVVYNNRLNKVIDCVSFNTHQENITAVR